jgi:hypothetical protein
MKSKKETSKPVADITKPKKRSTPGAANAGTASDAAPHLIIPKRPIIIPVSSATAAVPVAESAKPKTVAKSIKPQSELDPVDIATPTRPVAVSDSTSALETDAKPTEAAAATDTPAPDITSETKPIEPPAAAKPAAADDDITPDEDTEEPTDDPKSTKTSVHVRKALDDARREQEIQSYIDNREFFVPINAIARKKTLKVSAGLVLLELFLGVVLIDLMLDAGVIELLQKVPHTHIFNIH